MFTSKLSGNKGKVAQNVVWAISGKLANMAGALFVGILVARYLGPKNYGLLNYVISYVIIFSTIADFGMPLIEVRELSRDSDNHRKILGTAFFCHISFAFVAYSILCLTLWVSDADSFTSLMIMVYGLTLFTQSFNVIRNYFTSIIENKYVVKSEMARVAIGAVIKIVLLWMKMPIEYFIVAQLFDTVLVSSGYIISYKTKGFSILEWTFDKQFAKYLLRESFPLVLSGAAVVIYQRIDQVMIGNMIDKESVGYFATAGKFLDLILFLPIIITQTVVPLVIQAKDKGKEEYIKKQKQMVGIVVWIAILLTIACSLSSYWLVYFTYGENYLQAVSVLQIMAWKTLGMALSSSAGQIIIIERIQKWAVLKNVLGCFCCVILNYIFLPTFGIKGAAFITIVTTLVAGWFGNLLIPSYRPIFKLQTYGVFCGWKELIYFKDIIKNK